VQTDRQNHTHTDENQHLISVTVVGVSNYTIKLILIIRFVWHKFNIPINIMQSVWRFQAILTSVMVAGTNEKHNGYTT